MTTAGYSIPLRNNATFVTTPAEIEHEIEAMCAAIGAGARRFLAVEPVAGGRSGWCFANVDGAEVPGRFRVNGWLIGQSPAWLNAEFRSELGLPDGGLLDVTPKHDKETTIVFAPNERYGPDFDFLRRPNNIRLRAAGAKEGTGPIPPVPASIATPARKRERARLIFPIKGSSYSAIHRHAGAPLRILKAVVRTDPE